MSLDIYTNSQGKLVIKGNAKLSEEELELLIASLMCELSARLPLDEEELELLIASLMCELSARLPLDKEEMKQLRLDIE